MLDRIAQLEDAPLFVIDFRVLAWKIAANLPYVEELERLRDKPLVIPFIHANWAAMLNRGIDLIPPRPYRIIVVDDSKPYWREDYLEQRGYPTYKGNRKPKPSSWDTVSALGLGYVQAASCPWLYLCAEGLEADDWAAYIVQSKPSDRVCILHTLDSDWMQLVSAKTNTYWHNTHHWAPRFRGEQEVHDWAMKRFKYPITCPRDIAKMKQEKGDKSDNLLPGSPLEVFDLFMLPEQYSYPLLANRQSVLSYTENTEGNNNIAHYKKASQWLAKNGLPNLCKAGGVDRA